MRLTGFFDEEEWNNFLKLLPHIVVDEIIFDSDFNCNWSDSEYFENLHFVPHARFNSIHFYTIEDVVFSGYELFYYPPTKKNCSYEIPFQKIIPSATFLKNRYLKEICLSGGNHVYENVFYNLCSLEKVITKKKMAKYFSQDGVLYLRLRRKEMNYEPGIYLVCYPCNNPNKIFAIPDFVTHLAPYAFANSCITSVKLPIGLKSIGNRAFYNCKSLRSITIPNSVPEYVGTEILACCSEFFYITARKEDSLSDKIRKELHDVIFNGRKLKKDNLMPTNR